MRRRERARTFSTEELTERLFDALEEVKDCQVIVEGIKDKRALESIGFSKIHVLNSSLYETAMGFRGVVLVLTDFDPEGEEIARKLSALLAKAGCRVDSVRRKKLKSLFIKNKINTVEGLKNLNREADNI